MAWQCLLQEQNERDQPIQGKVSILIASTPVLAREIEENLCLDLAVLISSPPYIFLQQELTGDLANKGEKRRIDSLTYLLPPPPM